MEWDDLKHFLAVARSGSLTEAARALKASAATVGRHIDALEKRLGARLFEHRSTGYILTDLGHSVMVRAEEAEAAVLAVEREVAGVDRRLSGKVRVDVPGELLGDYSVKGNGDNSLIELVNLELYLVRGVGEINLADPDPNPLDVFLFFDHPRIRDRVQFCITYDPWSRGGTGQFIK